MRKPRRLALFWVATGLIVLSVVASPRMDARQRQALADLLFAVTHSPADFRATEPVPQVGAITLPRST